MDSSKVRVGSSKPVVLPSVPQPNRVAPPKEPALPEIIDATHAPVRAKAAPAPGVPAAVLDKNFRLSRNILPVRYEPHLTLNPAENTFSGKMKIELDVKQATSFLPIHGRGLEIGRASAVTNGGKRQGVTAVVASEASETLGLQFAKPIGPGKVTLELEWTGEYDGGLKGIYKAGEDSVTQFEPADARQLFPSFDEPGFKAPWGVTVTVPNTERTTLGNGEIKSVTEADGKKTYVFEDIRTLSTYLVALVSGNFVCAAEGDYDGTPIRIWSNPDKAHLQAFALEAAKATLPLFEKFFGIKYPYEKLDMVAIANFAAGAMENARAHHLPRDGHPGGLRKNAATRPSAARGGSDRLTSWRTSGTATSPRGVVGPRSGSTNPSPPWMAA